MEVKKIKDLYKRGLVPYASYEKALIVERYYELIKTNTSKLYVYYLLSEEFHKSEGTIRNIVTRCR